MVTWTSHGLICQLHHVFSAGSRTLQSRQVNTHILSVPSSDYHPHPAYSYEPGLIRTHTASSTLLQANMSTISRVSVILVRPEDWEPWILIVKALASDSWQYIDPSATTALNIPERPQPSDFGGTNSSNIDANQRAHWIEFNNLYYRELKDYERKKGRIDKAEEFMITHLDKSYLLQKAN